MTEKEIIEQLKKLHQIKPNQDWAVFAKKEIFAKEPEEKIELERNIFTDIIRRIRIIFEHKIFALAVSSISIALLFVIVQGLISGNSFFSLKKVAKEKNPVVDNNYDSDYALLMAQQKLENLLDIVKKNEVEKLEPVINEYQQNLSEIAKEITNEQDSNKLKKTVEKITELQNKEKEIRVYGVEIGDNQDLEKAYVQKMIDMLESLVSDIKNRNLTEREAQQLKEAEVLIAQKDYEKALLKLLYLNNN